VSRRFYLRATLASAGLIGVAFVAAAWFAPVPRIIWNASASAPIGLYRVDVSAVPVRGDLAVIQPPRDAARFMAERHYLPVGVPLLKHIAGLSGDRICRNGTAVTVDGITAAIARRADRLGRPLPEWRGCRIIRADEIFLLNAAPDSLDGRYFGAMPASGLIGRAHPLLTRDAPDLPLRWRDLAAPPVSPPAQKEPKP